MLLSYMSPEFHARRSPKTHPNRPLPSDYKPVAVSPLKSALTELMIPKDLISLIIRTYRKTGVGSQPSQPVLFSAIHAVIAVARSRSTLLVSSFRCDNASASSTRTMERL
jgi:hypothetical protein